MFGETRAIFAKCGRSRASTTISNKRPTQKLRTEERGETIEARSGSIVRVIAHQERLPAFFSFFSCIAERARDMVGQLLGIRKRK